MGNCVKVDGPVVGGREEGILVLVDSMNVGIGVGFNVVAVGADGKVVGVRGDSVGNGVGRTAPLKEGDADVVVVAIGDTVVKAGVAVGLPFAAALLLLLLLLELALLGRLVVGSSVSATLTLTAESLSLLVTYSVTKTATPTAIKRSETTTATATVATVQSRRDHLEGVAVCISLAFLVAAAAAAAAPPLLIRPRSSAS